MDLINIDEYTIDRNLSMILPKSLSIQYKMLVLFENQNNIVVAISGSNQRICSELLKIYFSKEILFLKASEDQILRSIDTIYFSQLNNNLFSDNNEVNSSETVNLLNNIIKDGIAENATDIHLEPMNSFIRLRYRIDGVLIEKASISKDKYEELLIRIKILSKLDIAESKLAQDGRVKLEIMDREVDLRVSTLPLIYGEKIVIRILDKDNFNFDLTSLGFSDYELDMLKKIIRQPNGIILVTGPAGSGKTTTLYTILKELNSPEKNILSIEDPIEYRINGVNQSQVNERSGYSFKSSLEAMLRQDPNVIMLGEIREEELAKLAFRAAITGHLVLSTLHTNDGPSSILRLLNMGVDMDAISSSLLAIISQRLVRNLCDECKEAYPASQDDKISLGLDKDKNYTLYKPIGCRKCRDGFRGRRAVMEILLLDRRLNKDFDKQFKISKGVYEKTGLNTLFQSTVNLILDGKTSIEEGLKVHLTL